MSHRFIHAVVLTASLTVFSPFAPVIARPGASFNQTPTLVGVSTTQPAALISGGTYKFQLRVPQTAIAPLQAVTISPVGNANKIKFAVNQTQVVAEGHAVAVSAIGGETSTDVTIAFEQPIQPGETVTISLPVERNAARGGIYQFGVTAYPAGDSSQGLFLGHGSVTLFDQDG